MVVKNANGCSSLCMNICGRDILKTGLLEDGILFVWQVTCVAVSCMQVRIFCDWLVRAGIWSSHLAYNIGDWNHICSNYLHDKESSGALMIFSDVHAFEFVYWCRASILYMVVLSYGKMWIIWKLRRLWFIQYCWIYYRCHKICLCFDLLMLQVNFVPWKCCSSTSTWRLLL